MNSCGSMHYVSWICTGEPDQSGPIYGYGMACCRSGECGDDTDQLYQFADQTGILDIHREWLGGRQVGMKIVFYELIRMIIGHEREKCGDDDKYDLTRSVGKIEGYQEVTNQMQRIINQTFTEEIHE